MAASSVSNTASCTGWKSCARSMAKAKMSTLVLGFTSASALRSHARATSGAEYLGVRSVTGGTCPLSARAESKSINLTSKVPPLQKF